MDPQSPPQPAITAAPTKLRLMCSYGGHLTPRPRTKSLSYLGGETRIISVDPTTVNTLSSFISHLLTILPIKPPFSLKYQLPHSPLDSLISLSSDDDLQLMLYRHLHLSSSTSSRIRLFILFPEPEKTRNVIHHPKTEAWFVDALKSAKISQKGRDFLVGFDGDALIGENEAKVVADLGNGGVSLAESMLLETSSSFESSSSSDFGLSSLDNTVKLPTTSDSVATLSSENPVQSNFHGSGVYPQNPIGFSGYALASRPNSFQQQALRLVDSCQLPAVYPMPSYYPVQQPQFVHYQPMPSHIYPVYILPVGQTRVSAPSNLPAQWDLHNAATGSLSHPLPQVAYKEVTPEPRTQEFGAMAMKSADGVQQQPVNISNDAAAAASGEVACTHNECGDDDDNNDDPERTLIYKSQPPPPPPLVPSQLQSKAQATTNILSDAMSQLQMIQTKP
ncbi:uncharacterized protein LOC111429779 [Cucurbita moschata]|uniref:Uncharacterized protein LOC111429779 n=1 Tax=Cucurbita moschata TaxID=3662 RepID=A0A6J1E0T6_CUCMO|nr:uncharacterized protein LOC111429779 [Cucurbita moschata]